MLTVTQVIGIIVAILLTGMFLVIGYQIVLILQEVRQTLHKANQVMDDAGRITKSIADPAVSLSGFITGIKDGAKLVAMIAGKNKSK